MMTHLVAKTKKIIQCIFICILAVLLVSCKPQETEQPTETEVIPMHLINGVNLVTTNPIAYDKVEFALFDTQTYKDLELNPFDYREVMIKGRFHAPSGKEFILPAFWYQDYEFFLNTSWTGQPTGISGVASTNPLEPQGLEMVNYIGDPHFRLRYLPQEVGTHNLDVEVYKDGAIVQVLQTSFEVAAGVQDYKGVLKVEETHKRNFVFEDGSTFIPIGQNTGWYTSSTRQTEDYRVWFDKMNQNNANFTRIWMGTWSFALHWGNDYDDFTSRQPHAARLDKVVELAREYDIYYMLTLLNHGQFSATVNAQWASNPWNKAKGGILDYPAQFFTNVNAKETYKQQLLYIIGRWGYSSHLAAWELFNEVDWTDNFNSTSVYMWHIEMAEFVKENDPYKHMITTSYKGRTGGAYQSKWIEFVNPHDYGYSSKNVMTHLTPVLQSLFNNYQKPVLHSEIGVNWENGRLVTEADPTGISLKQSQWAGMMGGGAGAAMNWWWDSWVHPNDLYYRFKGAGAFAKEMNMVGETYNQLNSLSGVTTSLSNVDILGYKIDNRVYGYAYDADWRHNYTTISEKTASFTIPLASGNYEMTIYNTDTGEIVETRTLTISNGMASFNLTLTEDIAFIILEE